MIEKKVIIKNEHGIHMRPALRIVDEAEKFSCDIVISKGSTKADAKSIMQVALLGALNGEEITITADGKDEQEAIDALEELIENDFELETTLKSGE